MHTPTHFQQLLQAAAAESEPQRLLFVFAAAELTEDASPAQRARFAAGQGGSLVPLICVDKAPDELASFEALRTESALAGPPWQVVFVAALGGRQAAPQVERALQAMVERVRHGRFEGLLALDREGRALSFD